MTPARRRIYTALGAVLALAGAWLLLRDSAALDLLHDSERLRDWVGSLGALGPLAIVALMTVAILVSPIPSAPIALAAGAAYGHTWGAVYVLAGAEAGAIAAFGLARVLGRDVMKRWLGDRVDAGLLGSQAGLMGLVFVSRLLPFISFDLVSYAAGLTALSFWRFAIATLAGIVPASFVLAHFGSELASGEGTRILLTALALGIFTAVPVAGELIRRRRSRRRPGAAPTPRD